MDLVQEVETITVNVPDDEEAIYIKDFNDVNAHIECITVQEEIVSAFQEKAKTKSDDDSSNYETIIVKFEEPKKIIKRTARKSFRSAAFPPPENIDTVEVANQNNKARKRRRKKDKIEHVIPTKKRNVVENCPCRLKCHTKIDGVKQKELFNDYSRLESALMRRAFLSSLIVRKEIVRRRIKLEEGVQGRKTNTRVYYLPVRNGEKERVCLNFFCSVFEISSGVIGTIIRNRTLNGALIPKIRSKTPASETNSRKKPSRADLAASKPPRVTEICNCRFKCHTKVRPRRQKAIFRDYCDLRADLMQKSFLSSLLVVKSVQRRKAKKDPTSTKERKRSCSCYLPIANGEKARVCQKFFCSVFQISTRIIDTIVKHRTANGALILKQRDVKKKSKRRNLSVALMTPHEFKNIEDCKCKFNCPAKVDVDAQKDIFEEYCSLQTTAEKKEFLLMSISEKEFTRRGNDEQKTEVRKIARSYYLPVGSQKFRVCCKFFCGLFQISAATINTVVKSTAMEDVQKQRTVSRKEAPKTYGHENVDDS